MPVAPGRSRYLRSRYLAPDERVLYEAHPSKWFYFPKPLAALAVLLGADYALASALDGGLPAIPWLTANAARLAGSHPLGISSVALLALEFAGVLTVAGLLVLGYRVVEWIRDTYVVTDDRVIEQKGIVLHTFQEIPIRQIRDVDVHQERWSARFLNFGTLRLKSLGEVEMADEVLAPSEQVASRSGGYALPKSAFPARKMRPLFNPRTEVAKSSGVEWWVGVPDPLRIERTIEEALRASPSSVPPAK